MFNVHSQASALGERPDPLIWSVSERPGFCPGFHFHSNHQISFASNTKFWAPSLFLQILVQSFPSTNQSVKDYPIRVLRSLSMKQLVKLVSVKFYSLVPWPKMSLGMVSAHDESSWFLPLSRAPRGFRLTDCWRISRPHEVAANPKFLPEKSKFLPPDKSEFQRGRKSDFVGGWGNRKMGGGGRGLVCQWLIMGGWADRQGQALGGTRVNINNTHSSKPLQTVITRPRIRNYEAGQYFLWDFSVTIVILGRQVHDGECWEKGSLGLEGGRNLGPGSHGGGAPLHFWHLILCSALQMKTQKQTQHKYKHNTNSNRYADTNHHTYGSISLGRGKWSKYGIFFYFFGSLLRPNSLTFSTSQLFWRDFAR